jgi:hypothetical protein
MATNSIETVVDSKNPPINPVVYTGQIDIPDPNISGDLPSWNTLGQGLNGPGLGSGPDSNYGPQSTSNINNAKGTLGTGSGSNKGTDTEPRGVTKEAAAVAGKSADTSLHKSTSKNGEVTIDIAEVAVKAGLNADNVLAIYTYLCGPGNINLLAAWMYLLYNGSGAVGMTVAGLNNPNLDDQPISISGNMLMYMWVRGNSVIKKQFHNGVLKAFKKTPAYKDKFFEDVGEVGVTCVSNADRATTNPMTGSPKHTPSLIEQALNKIHPKFCEELEKYCNVLKGKLYLALPANILGSIQYVMNQINGIITAFAQMIQDVYNGMLDAIKEFVAALDTIMQAIMLWLLTLLEKIIPLDIICLILDVLSVFVGDLTVYTNLFSQSVKISDFLKTFNLDLGPVGDFLSDPTGTLKSFLPEDVKNVIDLVNGVSEDPMGYLGTVLNNYGHGYMMNYLKGDVMGGILNQFGSQAPILYPLAGIAKKYGFNGQIQLSDPNAPSPNVVLPPAITTLRKNIKRTMDSLGDSMSLSAETISDSMFEVTNMNPNQQINPLFGITRQ